MSDALADSTALLERLIARIAKEADPVKYDQLAAEIWRVLEECESLKDTLALKEKTERESVDWVRNHIGHETRSTDETRMAHFGALVVREIRCTVQPALPRRNCAMLNGNDCKAPDPQTALS